MCASHDLCVLGGHILRLCQSFVSEMYMANWSNSIFYLKRRRRVTSADDLAHASAGWGPLLSRAPSSLLAREGLEGLATSAIFAGES